MRSGTATRARRGRKPALTKETGESLSPLQLITAYKPYSTQIEFGELVGISARTVRDYQERGSVFVAERGKIDVVKSLHGYLGRLREQASGRSDASDDRRVLEQYKAKREELAYRKEAAEVLDLVEVKEAWSRFAVVLRTSAMSVPSRARARIPHLTAHDGQVLDVLMREFLVDLAKELESGTVPGATEESISPDDDE